MHPSFTAPPRRAVGWLAVLLLAVGWAAPKNLRAASPAVDSLINKLPDPGGWTKSPLETALKDPDPILRDPDFRQVLVALQKHDASRALQLVRPLTAKYPGKPELQMLRGLLALSLKGYGEAESSFRAVIANKDAAAIGWMGLAGVQAAENRLPDAAASLHKVLALQPSMVSAWLSLASIEARRGRFADGVDAAGHVTRMKPTLAVGWNVLGYCEASEKRYDAAITDFRRAIADARNDAFAYEGLEHYSFE